MARIFISYKRLDKEKVFKIKDQIESALGEKCWIDLDGIESDAQFANVIINAINTCQVFLFMYSSAHSNIVDYERDWTVRELDFAQYKEKRIVFINIDGSKLSDWFYMFFGTKQQIDATNKDAVSKLIVDLSTWLRIPSPEANSSERPKFEKVEVIDMFQYVDLGLSVKWATCNIGATKPEEYGLYFSWGDVKGMRSTLLGGVYHGYPSVELDADKNLKLEYDAAQAYWGGKWRMPTNAEFKELIKHCSCFWTDNYNGTGVAGRIFTSKKIGFTDKSIFLPAAGYFVLSSLRNAGSEGGYWSSTFDDGNYSYCLYFDSRYLYSSIYPRYTDMSVRPVTE